MQEVLHGGRDRASPSENSRRRRRPETEDYPPIRTRPTGRRTQARPATIRRVTGDALAELDFHGAETTGGYRAEAAGEIEVAGCGVWGGEEEEAGGSDGDSQKGTEGLRGGIGKAIFFASVGLGVGWADLFCSDADSTFEFTGDGSFSQDQDGADIGRWHCSFRVYLWTFELTFLLLQYYKPWELRPRDEDIIQDQIDDAEDLIAREVAEFEARNPPPSKEGGEEGGEEGQPTEKPEEAKEKPAEEPAPLPEPEPKKEKPNEPNEPQKPEVTTHEQASDMNVGTGGDQKPAEVTPGTDDTATNGHDQNDAGHAPPPPVVPHDDGGEVVEEDNEDTVIY